MERERDSGQGGVGADGDRSRKPRGGARTGSMSVAGWVITALVSTLAMGISGASGCGDTIDSKGQTETAGQREALGEAHQAAGVTTTKCIVINTASGAKNSDTMISLEKPDDNYGAQAFAQENGAIGEHKGAGGGGGASRFYQSGSEIGGVGRGVKTPRWGAGHSARQTHAVKVNFLSAMRVGGWMTDL